MTSGPRRAAAKASEAADAVLAWLQTQSGGIRPSTPWRALAQLAAGWPTLRFDARPTYDGP